MPRKKIHLDFEESSGNVFADIGIPDAEEYLTKAKLAHQIIQIIKAKKLTQVDAAKLLQIDQPKISALTNGRLNGFSIERLFRFLKILNQDIVIMLKPHNENNLEDSQHIFVGYFKSNEKDIRALINRE